MIKHLDKEMEEYKTKLKKRNYDKYIVDNLWRKSDEKVIQLEKDNDRIRKELHKKSVEIKHLQGDLHHYYNRCR